MELLAMLSFGTFCISLFIVAFMNVNIKKDKLNFLVGILILCFGIWSFSIAFFYIAPNKVAALFWYKISGVGWIGFPAMAVHFVERSYKRMTGKTHKRYVVAAYTVGFFLSGEMILLDNSPTLTDVKWSQRFEGWYFINEPDNVFLWIYVFYMVVCLSIWFIYARRIMRKNSNNKISKQVLYIIRIDMFLLLVCGMSDIFAPVFYRGYPPIANVVILIFVIRVYYSSKRSGIFTVLNIVTAQIILDKIIAPVFFLNTEGSIMYGNKAAFELFEYSREQLVGAPIYHIISEKDQKMMREVVMKRKEEIRQIHLHAKSGYEYTMLFYLEEANLEKYGTLGIIVSFQDITNRKRMEAELLSRKTMYQEMALMDSLTHIPNRVVFFSEFDKKIEKYYGEKKDFAVVMIDLNNFKNINDTLGHSEGDNLLKDVAKFLSDNIREGDIVSRLGGDEFGLLLELASETEYQHFENRIRKLQSIFAETINQKYKVEKVTMAIGYAYFSQYLSKNTTLKHADENMYINKREQKKSVK